MDGDPLVAEFVAGRRLVGACDEGLLASDIDGLARRMVGDVRPAMAGEIGNDAGRCVRLVGQNGLPRAVVCSSELLDRDAPKVVGHAAGELTVRCLPLKVFKMHVTLRSGRHPCKPKGCFMTMTLKHLKAIVAAAAKLRSIPGINADSGGMAKCGRFCFLPLLKKS